MHKGTNKNFADVYDPAANRWKMLKSMPFGLGHIAPSVVPHQHGILVVGGTANNRAHPNKVMFYDTLRNTWTQLSGAGTVRTAESVVGVNAATSVNPVVDVARPSQVCGIVNGRLYIQSERSCYSGAID